MLMQLLRACALLLSVTGIAVAADKPKGKNEKPSIPTGGAVVGPLLGPDAATQTPHADQKFVVTKPVGTWVRDVQLKEGAVRVRLTITDDRVTLKAELTDGTIVAGVQFDADYAINKESCMFGVLDTFSTDQALAGQVGNLTSMSGQPFAVRFRTDEKTLSIKEFKGFGIGVGESTDDNVKKMLLAVCGQYAVVDPTKPLPELKVKAGETRLGGVPLPTPHYLKHYPTYFDPDTPNSDPLKRQEELLNQSEGPLPAPLRLPASSLKAEPPVGTHPTAFAGPVHTAMAELTPTQSPRAEFVLTRAEELAPLVLPPIPQVALTAEGIPARWPTEMLPLQPIPQAALTPQCDPPTDAEVLEVFHARRAKGDDPVHDDITIVKNLVADKIEAPRAYPVMGTAQLHHCRWECGVYYNDLKQSSSPYPTAVRKPKVEVIVLDTDCLRVIPAKDAVVPKRMPEK